jgi:hypothetical protein
MQLAQQLDTVASDPDAPAEDKKPRRGLFSFLGK